MLTATQVIERVAHRQLRQRVRATLQPAVLTAVVAQEVNGMISEALNAQLAAERDEALQRAPYERTAESVHRNGFKPVKLPGLWGLLNIQRPAVRKGSLRLPLLDALKGAGKGLRDILAVRFWLRGASTRAVAQEIRAATGAKLSASTVSTLTNALEPMIREWESRPIPPDLVYLFLDALYLPVRRPGFTHKQAILLAIGVGADGRRHVLGFLLGDRESEDSWTAFLRNLLDRGLKREALRMVISDEHKGIEAAVARLLGITHQFCIVHHLRNVKTRVARPDWKAVLEDLHAIYWAPDKAQSLQALGAFKARWARHYPRAVELVAARYEDRTRFLDEPLHLWTLLRSTNLIERFNLELRRRFRSAGTMHSELEVSKLFWVVAQEQEKRWPRVYKPRGGTLAIRQLAHA